MTVEADDPTSAVALFVRASESELVSCSPFMRGRETIATVKRKNAVFLVRIYEE